MKTNNITFILIGGLLGCGAWVAYRFVGKKFRNRVTSTAAQQEQADSDSFVEATEMMLSEEDED